MRSILEPYPARECYICGTPIGLEEHHIFGGPDRKMSERFGLKVHICYRCHRGNEGVHFNRKLQERLFIVAKKEFRKRYPDKVWLDYFRKEYVEVPKEIRRENGQGFTFIGGL